MPYNKGTSGGAQVCSKRGKLRRTQALVWSAPAGRVPLAAGAKEFEIEVDSLLESYLCVVVLNAIFRKLEP